MSSPKYPDAEIEATGVKFKGNGVDVGGYVARPKTAQALPGLLLVHEWWGLSEHIKDVARRYAREGFVTLAVDLYDGRVTQDADQAGQWMGALKPEEGIRRIQAGFDYLSGQSFVKRGQIGITGFCMGGSFALRSAQEIAGLKAAAPFYGDVPDPDDPLKNIRCPFLFIGAEKDPWINLEKMGRLQNAIAKYALQGTVHIYPGAQHAFFNNTRAEVFNPDAAADAWQRVTAFLHQHLA